MDPSALSDSRVVLDITFISAVVTRESLLPRLGPAIGTAAILNLVVRPAMAFLVTLLVCGLTALPVARALGVRAPGA